MGGGGAKLRENTNLKVAFKSNHHIVIMITNLSCPTFSLDSHWTLLQR